MSSAPTTPPNSVISSIASSLVPGRPEAVDERRVRSASSGLEDEHAHVCRPGKVLSVQFGQTKWNWLARISPTGS